jgi:hypothetical protein
VNGDQREVAVYNSQFITVSVYQTLNQGNHPCAAWSLEVTVFYQGNRRVVWPL